MFVYYYRFYFLDLHYPCNAALPSDSNGIVKYNPRAWEEGQVISSIKDLFEAQSLSYGCHCKILHCYERYIVCILADVATFFLSGITSAFSRQRSNKGFLTSKTNPSHSGWWAWLLNFILIHFKFNSSQEIQFGEWYSIFGSVMEWFAKRFLCSAKMIQKFYY